MKITWFRGLALSLGIASMPNIASAQYTYGQPGTGLAGSSYSPLPAVPSGNLSGYMSNSRPMSVSQVGYAQSGPIGSGVPGQGHVHVPQQAVPAQATILDNQFLNSPYTIGGGQAPSQYDQSLPAPAPNPGAAPHPGAAQNYGGQNYGGQNYNSQNDGTPNYGSSSYGSSSIAPIPMVGSSGPNGSGVAGSAYDGAGSYLDGYGMGSCGTSSYACAPTVVAPNSCIFGANALLFTRADHEYARLTSDSNMPTYSVLSTADARMLNTAGFEVFGGRYFGCGRYALIGSYWGLFSDQQEVMITPGAGVNFRSNIPFTVRGPGGASVPYGIQMPANYVYDWYDGSAAQRFIHTQNYQNAELNLFSFALGGGARQGYAGCGSGGCGTSLLGSGYGGGSYGAGGGNACSPCASSCATGPTGPCAPWYGAQCSKLRINLYGGVRWFQFRDYTEYATSRFDTVFNNGVDDFYYRNTVRNDLVGAQFGSLATWCTGCRFNLWTGANFGVYNNHVSYTSFAGTGAQAATVLSTNAYNGMPYSFTVNKNDLALLGEATLGTGFCICKGWTGNLGYRIIGVSGVATSVGQIPRDFSALKDAQRISNDRSLILHGLVAGAAYNF